MNITLFIKTFERPQCARNLIASARSIYPALPIIVVDDSREASDFGDVQYIRTEFDIGVSRGRNMAGELVKTKYFFCCDDDNLFTPSTDLELAKRLYEENDLDILTVKQEGNQFYGTYAQQGTEIFYSRKAHGRNGDVAFYDFGPNAFLMRTDKIKIFPWDDRLKIGEHFAYFHSHWGKMRVGFTERISVQENRLRNQFYTGFRDRAQHFRSLYLKENGISAIHKFLGIERV